MMFTTKGKGGGGDTYVFVRPMWEHRRLVVVHAFIRKVVVDYLNELYKFLSSTKHAFVTCKKEKKNKALLTLCMFLKGPGKIT